MEMDYSAKALVRSTDQCYTDEYMIDSFTAGKQNCVAMVDDIKSSGNQEGRVIISERSKARRNFSLQMKLRTSSSSREHV
jgi:hypothetical protein